MRKASMSGCSARARNWVLYPGRGKGCFDIKISRRAASGAKFLTPPTIRPFTGLFRVTQRMNGAFACRLIRPPGREEQVHSHRERALRSRSNDASEGVSGA